MLKQFITKKIAAPLRSLSIIVVTLLLLSVATYTKAYAADTQATADMPEVVTHNCTLTDFEQSNMQNLTGEDMPVVTDDCLAQIFATLLLGGETGGDLGGVDPEFLQCFNSLIPLLSLHETTPTPTVVASELVAPTTAPEQDMNLNDLTQLILSLDLLHLSGCGSLDDFQDLVVTQKCVEPGKYEVSVENKNDRRVPFSWKLLPSGTATKVKVQKSNTASFVVSATAGAEVALKYSSGLEKKKVVVKLDGECPVTATPEPTRQPEATPKPEVKGTTTTVTSLPKTSSDSSAFAYGLTLIVALGAAFAVTLRTEELRA